MRSRLALLLFLAAAAMPASAQQGPANEEQRRRMEAMMAAMQPGPEHDRLARLAGSWDLEITMWSGPGGPSQTMKGTAENRMILGNRFLESRTTGGVPPMVIEALSIVGFDLRFNRYTTVGFDTWGTYYVTGAGTMQDSLVTMHGTDDDPIAGHTQAYDFHLRFVDDDTYVTGVVFTDSVHTKGKGPFKAVEIVHRRKK